MKKIIYLTVTIFLTGCFGPATFDSSTESSIKESAKAIVAELPESQHEEFNGALLYFIMGGPDGFKSMVGASFSGKTSKTTSEAIQGINLKKIDGLSGEAILAKYREELEKDRLKKEEKRIIREKEIAERNKIKTLKDEAQELLNSNNFKEALITYKALSEIASGVEAAEEGVEKTTIAMNEFTEKMNYLDKVEITEFSAKRIDTYTKKSVAAVRISLKNNGDRSLDKVDVVVYFQDKNGNTIFEKEYSPVFVSKYSYGSNNSPLKAGYVKEMDEGKYYTLDSPLTEWQEGKSIVKIVDVEFSK